MVLSSFYAASSTILFDNGNVENIYSFETVIVFLYDCVSFCIYSSISVKQNSGIFPIANDSCINLLNLWSNSPDNSWVTYPLEQPKLS